MKSKQRPAPSNIQVKPSSTPLLLSVVSLLGQVLCGVFWTTFGQDAPEMFGSCAVITSQMLGHQIVCPASCVINEDEQDEEQKPGKNLLE